MALTLYPVRCDWREIGRSRRYIYVYIFFNCNDNKDAHSMNARYNNEVFADTAAGRKALLQKVKDEVAAGRVNVSDKSAVEQDILKGEPTDASSKMQFGDIERMLFMA